MNSFKTTLAIALVALTSATAAVAEGPIVDARQPTTSVVSRADVVMATMPARDAGQLVSGEQSYVAAPTGMALTRAQVIAETLEAIRVGAIARGEQSPVISAMQLDSIRMAGQKALSMTTAGL